jgi:hypothetical protein
MTKSPSDPSAIGKINQGRVPQGQRRFFCPGFQPRDPALDLGRAIPYIFTQQPLPEPP